MNADASRPVWVALKAGARSQLLVPVVQGLRTGDHRAHSWSSAAAVRRCRGGTGFEFLPHSVASWARAGSGSGSRNDQRSGDAGKPGIAIGAAVGAGLGLVVVAIAHSLSKPR